LQRWCHRLQTGGDRRRDLPFDQLLKSLSGRRVDNLCRPRMAELQVNDQGDIMDSSLLIRLFFIIV